MNIASGQSPLFISDDVATALELNRPVVALETAVATHGLPAPRNIEAMAEMARVIRERGCTPAICLAMDGLLHVGASLEQVEVAARSAAREKASVRNLGSVLARGVPAGLTVSATLFAATSAGIRVFATGGIGGVHAGSADTGDVSSDLHQLTRGPVITVCAGAKSVLDIPRTLEYLEALGVPVFGYRTENFPAFYLTASDVAVPALDSPQAIVDVARVQWQLGYRVGIVIGNPLPAPEALPEAAWTGWLGQANRDAHEAKVQGKDVTPFLLDRVARYSNGETVRANLVLLRRNAELAAQIAAALTR